MLSAVTSARNYFTIRHDSVSWCATVPVLVTLPAQWYQVVQIQRHWCIINVLRCQFLDVVNFFCRFDQTTLHTVHAQTFVTWPCKCSCSLPCLWFVEPLCPLFHNKKRTTHHLLRDSSQYIYHIRFINILNTGTFLQIFSSDPKNLCTFWCALCGHGYPYILMLVAFQVLPRM